MNYIVIGIYDGGYYWEMEIHDEPHHSIKLTRDEYENYTYNQFVDTLCIKIKRNSHYREYIEYALKKDEFPFEKIILVEDGCIEEFNKSDYTRRG